MEFGLFGIGFNIKKMCGKMKNEKMREKNYENIRVG